MKRKEYEKALRKLQVELCALQDWVRHSGHTTVEGASVMVGISIVWSVLRGISYALLLIAVFAGRSTSPPVSTPLDPDKNTYQA